MNLETSLGRGLSYTGAVEGARQRYLVFEAADTFMVFSLSRTKPNSGNFNLVNRKAVEYVHQKFCGHSGVTSNDVVERSNRTKHAPTTLLALNVLYVLVAQKRARIDEVGSHSKLYFSLFDADAKPTVRRKKTKKTAKKKTAKRVKKKVPKKTSQSRKKKSALRKSGQEPKFRVHEGARYKRYTVETFLPHGEPSASKIRVRPIGGQGLSKNMRVKCGKAFRSRHPVGTKFKMWARVSDREGGTPFLYSPYNWEPDAL